MLPIREKLIILPIPQNIDFDKIATIALQEMTSAMGDWLKGRPTDEVALMNHVTGHLGRHRRGCDVGIRQEVRVISEITLLHRRGEKQVDQYGADLAVTVVIEDASWMKTALIQFKKCSNFDVKIERAQLTDAIRDPRTEKRSFILVADEERTGLRVKSAESAYKEFVSDKVQTFDCSQWPFFTQWLWDWLSCTEGEKSVKDEDNSIEAMLQPFVSEEQWVADWLSSDTSEEDDDYLPARAWLVLFLVNTQRAAEINTRLRQLKKR